MRNPTGTALLCVSALAAATWTSAAEAKRVFYEVNGHRYWYNSAKHSGPPVRRGRSKVVADSTRKEADQAKPAVSLRTDTATTTSSAPIAPRLVETQTAVEASIPRIRGLSRRVARNEARRDARRRLVEARSASLAAARQLQVAMPPPRPALSPISETPLQVKAAEIPAASPAASLAFTVVPPPGPVLINTVTYDFARGVKTTSLRDGAVFVESFDPQAFFRILPEPGPTATASIVAPTLADARNP